MFDIKRFSTSFFALILFTLSMVACGPVQHEAEVLPDEMQLESTGSEDQEQEGGEGVTENPESPIFDNGIQSDLLVLPDGRSLSSVKVSGSSLSVSYGSGNSFSESKMQDYLDLKNASMTEEGHLVQWAFMNLSNGEMIAQSKSSGLKIFGASSSKIFVAGALLDKRSGNISDYEIQRMAEMLVVSSNSAWTELQKVLGDGSADQGREANFNFTQGLGLPKTRGWQGYWGSIHGNELVPTETVQFLYETYQQKYEGAEWLWKLMYSCRTGSARGKKYLPKSLAVGGKTGTYDGPTENPQTGQSYTVRMRNHVLIFKVGSIQYGLAVLANSGSNESAALMAGGLLREYTEFTE